MTERDTAGDAQVGGRQYHAVPRVCVSVGALCGTRVAHLPSHLDGLAGASPTLIHMCKSSGNPRHHRAHPGVNFRSFLHPPCITSHRFTRSPPPLAALLHSNGRPSICLSIDSRIISDPCSPRFRRPLSASAPCSATTLGSSSGASSAAPRSLERARSARSERGIGPEEPRLEACWVERSSPACRPTSTPSGSSVAAGVAGPLAGDGRGNQAAVLAQRLGRRSGLAAARLERRCGRWQRGGGARTAGGLGGAPAKAFAATVLPATRVARLAHAAADAAFRCRSPTAPAGIKMDLDVQRALDKEVGLLKNMRHPNIILFMGVVLEPPAVVTGATARLAGVPRTPAHSPAVARVFLSGIASLCNVCAADVCPPPPHHTPPHPPPPTRVPPLDRVLRPRLAVRPPDGSPLQRSDGKGAGLAAPHRDGARRRQGGQLAAAPASLHSNPEGCPRMCYLPLPPRAAKGSALRSQGRAACTSLSLNDQGSTWVHGLSRLSPSILQHQHPALAPPNALRPFPQAGLAAFACTQAHCRHPPPLPPVLLLVTAALTALPRLRRCHRQGMLYLHGHKPTAIIHRDLKSPNLLVMKNWQVKVRASQCRGDSRGRRERTSLPARRLPPCRPALQPRPPIPCGAIIVRTLQQTWVTVQPVPAGQQPHRTRARHIARFLSFK